MTHEPSSSLASQASAPTLLEVQPDDPRVAELMDQMDREMGALYAGSLPDTPEWRERLATAFAPRPELIIVSVLAVDRDRVLGHGCLARRPEPDTIEVRRVMVDGEARGRGVSTVIMDDLERRARELGAKRAVLVTGERQLAAIGLYERRGYVRIPVFAPYDVVPGEYAFEKYL